MFEEELRYAKQSQVAIDSFLFNLRSISPMEAQAWEAEFRQLGWKIKDFEKKVDEVPF